MGCTKCVCFFVAAVVVWRLFDMRLNTRRYQLIAIACTVTSNSTYTLSCASNESCLRWFVKSPPQSAVNCGVYPNFCIVRPPSLQDFTRNIRRIWTVMVGKLHGPRSLQDFPSNIRRRWTVMVGKLHGHEAMVTVCLRTREISCLAENTNSCAWIIVALLLLLWKWLVAMVSMALGGCCSCVWSTCGSTVLTGQLCVTVAWTLGKLALYGWSLCISFSLTV